jgi:hypothetical protein
MMEVTMETEMNCLFVGCKMWVIIDAKVKVERLGQGKADLQIIVKVPQLMDVH